MKKGFAAMTKTAALQRYAACFTKEQIIREKIELVIADHTLHAMEAVEQQFFRLLWALYGATGSFHPEEPEPEEPEAEPGTGDQDHGADQDQAHRAEPGADQDHQAKAGGAAGSAEEAGQHGGIKVAGNKPGEEVADVGENPPAQSFFELEPESPDDLAGAAKTEFVSALTKDKTPDDFQIGPNVRVGDK